MVALFSQWNVDRQQLKLILVPYHAKDTLIEVSITFKISLSAAVSEEWELLRELRLPEPSSLSESSSSTEWKYLLSSTTAPTTHSIKNLYLIGTGKISRN